MLREAKYRLSAEDARQYSAEHPTGLAREGLIVPFIITSVTGIGIVSGSAIIGYSNPLIFEYDGIVEGPDNGQWFS